MDQHALRRPYRTCARARVMGEVEEVQKQMEADMEAMKEQMATMMEAMMSMKIMEANAVAVNATSVVAKVNPTSPSGINQMNHPTSNMTHEIRHHNLADFEPCLGYATEGQAVGGIPLQNTLEDPQYHPQLHLLHSTTSKNPHAMAEMGNEKGENEGETHVVTAIPIQPSFAPTQQCRYSANNKPSPYPPPRYPQRPSLNQPQSLSTALPMTNTTFSTNQNTNQGRNFAAKSLFPQPPFSEDTTPMQRMLVMEKPRGISLSTRKVQSLIDVGWLKFEENRLLDLNTDKRHHTWGDFESCC
ncbi:hypothetical protein HKD37_04G010452 [Glycine soja]